MSLQIEPQYFTPIIFYSYLNNRTDVIFFVCEEFKKMSFRNRCVVAGANGPINLTVPVIGGRQQQTPISDVRIDNKQKWQAQQWKTICSCYNRSPWFEYYRDSLQKLFQKPFEFLVDLDIATFEWASKVLGLQIPFQITSTRQNVELDLTDRITPRALKHQTGKIRYQQLFEERNGFLPDLSILDLVFCAGKQALSILKTQDSSMHHPER